MPKLGSRGSGKWHYKAKGFHELFIIAVQVYIIVGLSLATKIS